MYLSAIADTQDILDILDTDTSAREELYPVTVFLVQLRDPSASFQYLGIDAFSL